MVFPNADWGGNLWSCKLEEQEANKHCSVKSKSSIYIALASSAQEVLWLKHLLMDLTTEPLEPMVIYKDCQSVIASSQFHGCSEHLLIKYNFIRDMAMVGTHVVKYCPIQEMIANMLTKGLTKNFIKLCSMIGIVKCSFCQQRSACRL